MKYLFDEKDLKNLAGLINQAEREKTVLDSLESAAYPGDNLIDYLREYGDKNRCGFSGIELTGEETTAIKELANKIEREAL
jgi:hypothetical protein